MPVCVRGSIDINRNGISSLFLHLSSPLYSRRIHPLRLGFKRERDLRIRRIIYLLFYAPGNARPKNEEEKESDFGTEIQSCQCIRVFVFLLLFLYGPSFLLLLLVSSSFVISKFPTRKRRFGAVFLIISHHHRHRVLIK